MIGAGLAAVLAITSGLSGVVETGTAGLVSGVAQAERHAPGTRSGFVQGTLNLAAGERVVLRLKADGTFEMIEAATVGLEAALPPASGSQGDLTTLMKAEPGTIAFSLGLRRDAGSFLKIENGLDKGFGYAGYIVRFSGGRAVGPARTSVCSVMPGKLGFEHWQEPVIQVVAGSLHTVEDAPTCESPEVNQ